MSDVTVPMPCPAPECGESLAFEPYLSRIPLPTGALGYVHARCGLAWTREHARQRTAHALSQLAKAIRGRSPGLVVDVDEAELVLTVRQPGALGDQADRLTGTPGSDAELRFWWLSQRPSLQPEPPQMTPGALCSLPREMAACVEDRLILGITAPMS